MIRIALDTNVMLDWLLDRPTARQYDTLLAGIQNGLVEAVIDVAVFLEIDWVLKSNYHQTAAKRCEYLKVARDFLEDGTDVALVVDAALAVFEQRPTIGFDDAMIVTAAQKQQVDDFITGDKKLARVYQSLKKRGER